MSRSSSSESPPPDRRSPLVWWGLSAIFVVGVLIALVIVLAFGGNSGAVADPPPPPEPPASSAPSAPPSTGTAASCSLPPGEQTPPVAAPTVTWELTDYQMLTPFSATSGPATRPDSDGVHSCFSQDPVGALLAASHFVVLVSSPDEAQRLAGIEAWLLEGPGKEQALTETRDAPGEVSTAVPNVQLAGFRFVQYTQDDAYVTLARTVAGQEGIVKDTVHLRWSDGDWYVDGTDPITGEAGSSGELQAEFIPWGAN